MGMAAQVWRLRTLVAPRAEISMRNMMRHTALALVIVVMLAACATGETVEPAPNDSPATTAATQTTEPPATQPSVTESDVTTTTSAPDTVPPPQIEGPAAPDFTLALADGSSFTLGDEQKPVYLVFWAEW